MTGIVQRGEADFAAILVRSDSMSADDDRVRLGPTMGSGDDVMLSTKLTNETSSPTFVTDVIYNVDKTTYGLLLVVMLIVVTILTTSQWLLQKETVPLADVRRRLLQLIRTINWKILGLIVDQEDFQPSLWSVRFLWFHVCLAMFILIFGYFWNTMSTDITVSRPATYIDSIDYFLDTPPKE